MKIISNNRGHLEMAAILIFFLGHVAFLNQYTLETIYTQTFCSHTPIKVLIAIAPDAKSSRPDKHIWTKIVLLLFKIIAFVLENAFIFLEYKEKGLKIK